MNKKLFLVNTNLMKPLIAPIGLDYVAEAAAAQGFDVDIIDLALADDPDELLEKTFKSEQPALTGVTVRNIDDCYMASALSFVPDMARWVNKIRALSDAPIVLGGVGYSVDPVSVLDALGADYGIRGDGEVAVAELARRVSSGADVSDIPGLIYRDGDITVENPPIAVDLESVTPRRREFVDNASYFRLGGQGSIETKRGCAAGCVYCADPVAKGRNVRLAPPENVVDEMEALYRRGVDVLHTCDSEFNLPVEHAEKICDCLIRRGTGDRVKWYAYLCPAPFSKPLATKMKRAGCVGINFGADSAHPLILKKLGRKYSKEDIETAVSECRGAGIKVMLDLLIGGPGENIETVKQSIESVKKMDPDRIGISLGVRLFRGTLISRMVADKKLDVIRPREYPDESLMYPAFYMSPELGENAEDIVSDIVDNDPRFFFADKKKEDRNYNYNDNRVLVEAIRDGHRGAYWDILRKLAERASD